MDTAPARTAPPSPPPDPLSLPRLVAPTVSIVICNHNYARYLGEAIQSALAQRPRCQVIVVDDGSTDESRALLQQADPRVQVVLQPNAGQLAAYNTGFAHCTGDVVIFLDADDALQPHAARAMTVLFDDGVAKVHCRMDMVDETGGDLGGSVPSSLARGDVALPLRQHGVLYPSAPGSGNAYRRSVLQRLFPLPLDPQDRVGADFFTIYGAVHWGSVAACDAPLVKYRIHGKAPAGQPVPVDARPVGNAAPAAPATATAQSQTSTRVADALVFGNAAQGNDEAAKVARRYARLIGWLDQRTAGAVKLPAEFLDFAVQKAPYATAVLSRPYWQALRSSWQPLRRLLRSVWLQPAFHWNKKLGLSAWALLVLAAPRAVAQPLARYVCNPASRTA